MKSVLILCLLLLGFNLLKAQQVIDQQKGYHKHDGFYLSMNLGPVFSDVTDHVNAFGGSSAYTLDMSGQGAVMDMKIGGAIRENLILHATIISNSMSGPTIITTKNGFVTSAKASNSFAISDAIYGVGLTYYVMPSNYFVSGSIGIVTFTLVDSGQDNSSISTQGGLAMQFKLGKEWWVSKNWGLGVGVTYSKSSVTNEPSKGEFEHLISNRFGILFNTTFN